MYLHTKKQKLYFDEVIKLHLERGWGEGRISRILPIGHTTVSRWISIFAAENEEKSVQMPKSKKKLPSPATVAVPAANDVKALQSEITRLQAQVKHERLRADAYDEMINVAESKFNIPIRKKVGAKR